MLTPGVSFVKSRKLRPLLGRPLIAASSMRSAPSARVVSITGASAGDHDLLLHADTLRVKREVHRLADAQLDALADEGGEAGEAHGHAVGAEGQQQAAEAAVRVGRDRALEVGGRVPHDDRGAGDGGAALVEDRAFDDAGGGLGLREAGSGDKRQRNGQEARKPKRTRHKQRPPYYLVMG